RRNHRPRRPDRGGARRGRLHSRRPDPGRPDLRHAPRAVFARANLTSTDMWGGNFAGASFVGADLTGVKLPDADLRGADLTGATMTDAHLAGAVFDKETRWPAGFVVPGELTWAGRGTGPRLSGGGKKRRLERNRPPLFGRPPCRRR